MEPMEPVSYLKVEALSLAVQHLQHREQWNHIDALRIAEKFLEWLRKIDD